MKFLVGNKKAPADRTTIATILAVISEESTKKIPEAERFKCDSLHNPTEIKSFESTLADKPVMPVKPNADHWYSVETSAEYDLFMKTPSLKQ